MKAVSLIRPGPEYRRDAFAAGLKAAGFEYIEGWQGGAINRGDVLVIWNRYGAGESLAQAFEKVGATVLVAENGYIGKDKDGQQLYALARNGHNGSGTWYVGPDDRWLPLGIPVKPWREAGKHVLVCDQRGIGTSLMASPANWGAKMARRLRETTRREIRVRPHPGARDLAAQLAQQQRTELPPLEEDFKNCWAVVVWSSSSGIKALVEGIPVFFDAPHWSAEPAGLRNVERVDNPALLDRMAALRRMAWAQWRLEELGSGLAFEWILGRKGGRLVGRGAA